MGDWLDTGAAFGGNVRTVLAEIRAPRVRAGDLGRAVRRGREVERLPAASRLVHQGRRRRAAAIRSRDVRRLAARAVVRARRHAPGRAGAFRAASSSTMREEWGCTYFKLDANFWGAMHGGRFHDPRATRIEAYRRGMQAILRGAGDGFILGCNHPIWPSIGADPRIAQLERHQAHLGSHRDDGAAEPEPELAERPPVVERSGRGGAGQRSHRRRVPVSRDGDLRERRHGAVGRRSHEASAGARGDAQEAAAADRRRRDVRRCHAARRHRDACRTRA